MSPDNDPNQIATALAWGRDTADPTEVHPGALYVVSDNGGYELLDLRGDQYLDAPRRKQASVRVNDVDSFTRYVGKHGTDATEIYADPKAMTVTAVIDAHGEQIPGWMQHAVAYRVEPSTAWKAWTSRDGVSQPQADFAEFIEDNQADIADPPAADMLEIAQTLEGTTSAAWASGLRLADGSRRLTWAEEVTGKAGTAGDLVIPTVLTLRLRVFDNAQPVLVTARFRYRISGGHLSLLFKLDRPADVVRAAFDNIIDDVRSATERPVLLGTVPS